MAGRLPQPHPYPSGQRIEVSYTGSGRTQSWLRDPYAHGEASVLLPGQHTELLPSILTPEGGPLYFAGDRTAACASPLAREAGQVRGRLHMLSRPFRRVPGV